MEQYEKVYTRDTTMIIQQAWIKTLDIHRDGLGLAGAWAGKIQTLHYLHDGVIEIWENRKWTPSLTEKILETNRTSPKLFEEYTILHQKQVEKFKPLWAAGYTNDLKELIAFVDAVFEKMYYFDWMYYSSLDERTPPEIKVKADLMREKDMYFDETDRFIRRSLIAIYPHMAGYEQAILQSEITNPPTLEILQQRKKNFVVVGEHSNFLGTLEEYRTAHTDMTFEEMTVPTNIIELRGQVGSKGIARGRVRIMKRKEQIKDAQDGEVLVSTMTTPDFVPAMKKAAAIVTDEGGIMCHAAIVAREMKKPCVIGTKFATQVFKTGDMVEVDADNGIVRKI